MNVSNWCVCRCAITVGSLGDYEGPQERIENGFKFKVAPPNLLLAVSYMMFLL